VSLSKNINKSTIFQLLKISYTAKLRGEMIALYHFGLIEEYLGNNMLAEDCYQRALSLAKKLYSRRWQLRIEEALNLILGLRSQLEEAIANKKARESREILYKSEKERRLKKENRGVNSLIQYLPAIMYLNGKKQRALQVLKTIRDPVIKWKAILLCVEIGFKNSFISILKLNLETEFGFVAKSSVFDVIKVAEIPQIDIRNLLHTLEQKSGPVSKDEITQKLWNSSYDPTIHENKIHKVILKTRNIIKNHAKIVNHYGSYSLKIG